MIQRGMGLVDYQFLDETEQMIIYSLIESFEDR